ncbi:MAG TPA: hydrogenase maturation nickel metallochaperone HypA [Actinomycetota bacterium]|nr:hydrogenase maturation nickel metallochaperone HypA [Actinomycetota bacterium]
MHDYQAAEALIERLVEGLGPLDRITRVRIRVSPIYSPEALEQAFEIVARDTPIEGAELLVEGAREQACASCGTRWSPTHDDLAGPWLICPECAARTPLGPAGIEVLEVVGGPAPKRVP